MQASTLRRVAAVVVIALFTMGMSDCESDDDGSGPANIDRIDIDNYLRGSSTPPATTYTPPDGVATGDRLDGSLCVKDPQGAPVTGIEWFLSLFEGDPASGSHFSGTLNGDGCMSWFLDVRALPTTLKTSDGDQVWDVAGFDAGGEPVDFAG